MNYFVGHLIEGEAADWHASVVKDISDKFGTWKLHEKISPHITIFYPFSKKDISPIVDFLHDRVESQMVPGEFSILDFDHFDNRVVFAKISASQSVKDMAAKLRRELHEFPDMPPSEFPDWHPHATLANHLSPSEIDQIWAYVQTLKKPNYHLSFNNVSLFRLEGERKWVIERVFRFKENT